MKKYRDLFLRFIPMMIIMALTVILSEAFYRDMIASSTDKCWQEVAMAQDSLAREIGTRLNNNTKMLALASEGITLQADIQDEAAVCTYLVEVRKETIFDRIDVIFPDDTILLQATGERIPDVGEKTFQELLDLGPHLSPRVPDALTGAESIHAFSPVYDVQGEAVAILSATVSCSTLADTFTSTHYGDDAQFFLVDLRDGNLLVDKWHDQPGSIYDMRSYEDAVESAEDGYIEAIMSGSTGRMSHVSQINGKTSYTVYAPVVETTFSLIMVVQEDVIFAEVNEMKDTMGVVGLVEVGLLLLFALWIYYVIQRSMESERRAQTAELALLQEREMLLEDQYAAVFSRQEFLEDMAVNLPGGYHRCTTDHSFRLTFVSRSFEQITGYTLEQVYKELDGGYLGIVADEDKAYFMSLAPQLERDRHIQCGYRIRRRDGSIRWVKDATQYINRDGEAYYQCALMDITEQIEEIQEARRIAEASSHAKSTFLFNISHDIRTPLNAIKGFSHIIEENASDPQVVLDAIRKINQAGDSLMMLMNDVLDISRIERGKEELLLQPVSLHDLGMSLYEMFAADMRDAGIEFVPVGDEVREYVYCDKLKMTRVFMNMLSNAKKFTPAGGRVDFGVTRLRGDDTSCTYRFFVRDTGIGMSPEFLSRAFEQFERERTSTESGISGSGLGLAIIKMLVELMDGTVEIESELGKGTEIAATLTFRLAEENSLTAEAHRTKGPKPLTGKRILLVEDNAFNQEICRYMLESMEMKVEEAENGAICIEKLCAAEPVYYDLILMDIQMPVMDGYAATTKIRSMEDRQRASIPILAMTANAFAEDKAKCMEVGMNGHVGKPLEAETLMQAISDVLHADC